MEGMDLNQKSEILSRLVDSSPAPGITEREGHPAPPMPHLTEEAFLGLAANAKVRKIRIECCYPVKIFRKTLLLEMFSLMVGDAAGVKRRGPRTRRLGSSMAQELRIGNQWIRKQCLDLTGKRSQSVQEVGEEAMAMVVYRK